MQRRINLAQHPSAYHKSLVARAKSPRAGCVVSPFCFAFFLAYGPSGRAYDQLWFLSCSSYSELIQICWNAAVQLWLRNVECGDLLSAARHGSVLKLACRRGCSGHRYDLPRVVVDDLVFHVGPPSRRRRENAA